MYNEQITQEILARYAEKRKNKLPPKQEEQNVQLDSYLQAAAVLHCFNPETLKPLQQQYTHENVRLLLYDHISKTAGGISEGLFSLKMEVRQQILKKLGTRQNMKRALEANPKRIKTDQQQLFDAYVIYGKIRPRLHEMMYQQLTQYCQLITWLDGLDPELPSLSLVMQLLKQKSVLAGFEHLVDKNFTGRREELKTLRDHIINRHTKVLRLGPIISVCGPGGIGKSALVAQLLMENSLCEESKKILFAYLAFDQPTLRIESPFTIILEAISQLELQLPDYKYFNDFRTWVREFRDGQGNIKTRDLVEDTRGTRIDHSLRLEGSLYWQFGQLLRQLTDNGRRTFLLVLDTFEEVEYRDRESLSAFWYMLEEINISFPWFNVIIAGRTSIKDTYDHDDYVDELKLERLHPEDSVKLLINLGVEDARVADIIVNKVGGNPLSLRLAANLITSLKDDQEIRDIESLSFELDEQLIQGYLYSRILNHIHNEDVRKLAHPGMVLRVVSPGVILNVLAPICNLKIADLEQATILFEELKREHALVKTGPEGTLLYRPEIRQAMIRLLQQDKYRQVRQIHQRAIHYYYDLDNIESRAEEMYHRLALGEDGTFVLDNRWKDGIEKSVVQNLEEYTDESKAWLASRMSLEVTRDVYANVSIVEWEKNVTRKVQAALARKNTNNALMLLRERYDRTQSSPLFALEAKALLLVEQIAKAAEVLDRGIKLVAGSTNRGRLAELLWLRAQVHLIRKEPLQADRLLKRGQLAISKAISPMGTIHILCHRLALSDIYQIGTPVSIRELCARLNDACKRLSYDFKYEDRFIVRIAKSYLEHEYPSTFLQLAEFADGIQRPTIEMLTNENLRGLDEFRNLWEMGDSSNAYEALV